MIRSIVLTALRRASCHIGNQPRFRWYPVYACGLVLLVILSCMWPYNPQYWEIWPSHPWILSLDVYCVDVALKLAFMLGIVGLFRPGILAKGLSAYAVWESLQFFSPPFLHYPAFIWDRVLWYGFDIPTEFITAVAGGNGSVATMLWFGYLMLLWVAFRPVAWRLFRQAQKLEAWALGRWPRLRVIDRPVI